jgi:hypothetical protein
MTSISFDGVSLNDDDAGFQAQYPEDLGAPPVRGDDVVVPFRHGAAPTRKYYAPRTITINGYVFGPDRATLWDRIDVFKRLFDVTKGPRKLQVDWPDGSKRYLWAEPRNTLGLTGTHRTFTPFSVELSCADPFWRDDAAAQEAPYKMNTVPPKLLGDPTLLMADFDNSYDAYLAQQTTPLIVPNPGNMAIEDALIRVTFAYSTDALAINNLSANTSLFVNGVAFAAGSRLEIDCRRWRATYTTATDHVDVSDKLTANRGQRAPFVLGPGDNIVVANLGSSAPYGATLALVYAAAYL